MKPIFAAIFIVLLTTFSASIATAQQPSIPTPNQTVFGTWTCGPVKQSWLVTAFDNQISPENAEIVADFTGKFKATESDSKFQYFTQVQQIFPVQIAKGTGKKSLTKDDIRKILSGSVTNWKALDGADQTIHLYLHQGTKQKITFSALAEKFGVSGDTAQKSATPYDGHDYIALEKAAAGDAGAIVIGLQVIKPESGIGRNPLADASVVKATDVIPKPGIGRNPASDGDQLFTVSIDGIKPTDPNAAQEYPLALPTDIFIHLDRKDSATKAVIEAIKESKVK